MQSLHHLRRLVVVLAAISLMALCILVVSPSSSDARAGGGQSYGGGSRSSSSSNGGSRSTSTYSGSGSSGGGSSTYSTSTSSSSTSSSSSSTPSYDSAPAGSGGVFRFFILVVFVVAVVAIILALSRFSGRQPAYLAADDGVPQSDEMVSLPEAIARIKSLDKSFSETLFLDFVHLLFTRFQTERGAGKLEVLSVFVAPEVLEAARADTRQRGVTQVDEVLVGSSRISAVEGLEEGAPLLGIQVEIEANFTEHAQAGATRLYVRERWTLRRKRGVLSKGPVEMASLSCPSCGSPSEVRPDGSCPYCDRVVAPGDFQWMLASTKVQEVIAQHQPALTATADEEGTDFPDVIAENFDEARAAFMQRNPDFDERAFQERAGACFMGIQEAWSSGRWEKARPYETDHLFNTHRYWIEQYRRQSLVNRLDDVRIARQWIVRYDSDAYYEMITVRIHASMRDYVTDAGGRVVGGNPNAARAFSEYWTFIRTAGAPKASPKKEGGCPSCGAPIQVNMAGSCEYCGTKITSGDFEWVLSAIEQDESYGKDDVAILPGAVPPSPPSHA